MSSSSIQLHISTETRLSVIIIHYTNLSETNTFAYNRINIIKSIIILSNRQHELCAETFALLQPQLLPESCSYRVDAISSYN